MVNGASKALENHRPPSVANHPYLSAILVCPQRLRNVVIYFKAMSSEAGIPYQNLINLYLRDCAEHRRKLSLIWSGKKEGNKA